jgi:hypothetical protein
MMPEPLLDELEVTAALSGIRVALVMAYHCGRTEELKAWSESINRTLKYSMSPHSRCIAAIPTNSTGEEAVECGRKPMQDSDLCEKHAENL